MQGKEKNTIKKLYSASQFSKYHVIQIGIALLKSGKSILNSRQKCSVVNGYCNKIRLREFVSDVFSSIRIDSFSFRIANVVFIKKKGKM